MNNPKTTFQNPHSIYYPVFLNLKNKRCIIIGGGKIAERKALKLLETDSFLIVISPDLTPKLTALKKEKKIKHIKRRYKDGDLKDAFLVIAATSDITLNKKISAHAPALVNAVDMPDLCNFIVPSVVRRGHLNIAISTSGVSPFLSKNIRMELEKIYTDDFNRYLSFLKDFRKKIFQLQINKKSRERILKNAGSKESIKILRGKGLNELKDKLVKVLEGV